MADHRINNRKGARGQRVRAEVERLRNAKAAAYDERSRLVAALARLFPSGVQRTELADGDGGWQGCVYIDLPTGQASWHFQGDQAAYFRDLPEYASKWDGHTTEEKYERLAAAMAVMSEQAELGARLERAEEALRELLAHTEPSSNAAGRAALRRSREYLECVDGNEPPS